MSKESRAQCIFRHCHLFINSTATSWPTLASTVREIYEDTVPGHARRIQWSGLRDSHDRMRADAQTLRRFEADIKHGLPCELEESVVIALQELRYVNVDSLMTDLSARYGLLPVKMPASDRGIISVGQMAKEFGESMMALAPIVDDYVINHKDRPHAENAVKELEELVSAVVSVMLQVRSVMDSSEQGGG